ncbi:unnamed protein product, partial [Prunus brigantina]
MFSRGQIYTYFRTSVEHNKYLMADDDGRGCVRCFFVILPQRLRRFFKKCFRNLKKASGKFKRYFVIILDEVHERRLNTDFLIGMLSGVISARQVKLESGKEYAEQQKALLSGRTVSPGQQVFPLKVVLMSATMRIEDFINNRKLFRDPPPVIDQGGQAHPPSKY